MPSPFAEQRGRGPGGGPTAVGFEDLAHSRREEGQVSGAGEPRLLAVGHARGAVRQDSVEVGEVGPQLTELARDIGQDLLAGPARWQHRGEADVAPLEEDHEEVDKVLDGRGADVFQAARGGADRLPGGGELVERGLVRGAARVASDNAPCEAGPVGYAFPLAHQAEVLRIQLKAVVEREREREAVRKGDVPRVLPPACNRALGGLPRDHLIVLDARLGRPHAPAEEAGAVPDRDALLHEVGRQPAARAARRHQGVEGGAAAEFSRHELPLRDGAVGGGGGLEDFDVTTGAVGGRFGTAGDLGPPSGRGLFLPFLPVRARRGLRRRRGCATGLLDLPLGGVRGGGSAFLGSEPRGLLRDDTAGDQRGPRRASTERREVEIEGGGQAELLGGREGGEQRGQVEVVGVEQGQPGQQLGADCHVRIPPGLLEYSSEGIKSRLDVFVGGGHNKVRICCEQIGERGGEIGVHDRERNGVKMASNGGRRVVRRRSGLT